jgi:hypothetical protein
VISGFLSSLFDFIFFFFTFPQVFDLEAGTEQIRSSRIIDGTLCCTIPGTEKIHECKRTATLTPVLNGSKVSFERRRLWKKETVGKRHAGAEAKPWSSMRQQAAGSEEKIRAGT